MAISSSSLFTADEKSYRAMLDNGGIFVGDRWFPKDSTEVARAKYLISYNRRLMRNERRRARRNASPTPRKQRPLPRRIPIDNESQVANRMPLERRKCLRRSTIAECPTANEIRTAWRFRNVSAANRVRLGGMLMDLECYVDNSLIVIMQHGNSKIVGRHGGLRAWLRGNCPELLPHYKTLQRIKGIAKLMRQRLDVLDPVPVVALMDRTVTDKDISDSAVHYQPRSMPPQPVRIRFVWEHSEVVFDADHRPYFHNENYFFARSTSAYESTVDHLPVLRSIFSIAISLNGTEKCTNETYSSVGGEEPCERGVDVGGWRGMFAYIGEHPEFLAEAGVELARDVVRGLGDVLLPERTMGRIWDGEDVGIGMVARDVWVAYWKLVGGFLVYRWRRTSEMDYRM